MPDDLTKISKTPTMGEIAGRSSDPRFYAAMSILPNPDPILRKAGKSDEVFDAIQADAHVIGELRAIKADFLRFRHHLTAGGERRVDKRAYELCQQVLERQPAPYTRWPDVFWSIAQSTFRGLSVQEVVWEKRGDWFLPREVLDRPKRRFVFNADGELRALTRAEPWRGIPAERMYFLVDRHMPTYDNPYGVALLSSCFWPYTFKHAGFRWFIKFCERFSIPIPVGTYPVGAAKESKDALEDALENLIDAGYAALEEGSGIELKETNGQSSGKLAQHALIDMCNAEMSKALSSQTLASELPAGTGSRAAAETHAGRAADVNEGDRDRIIYTLNELWTLITLVNFGPGAAPPQSHFDGDTDATLERAKTYKVFSELGGHPSRKSMAEELGIELANPDDPDDELQSSAAQASSPPAQFSAPTRVDPAYAIADRLDDAGNIAIDGWVEQIHQMASAAHSLQELRTMIVSAYDDLAPDDLADVMKIAFQAAQAAGRFDVANEDSP
ncbi:MAG TPA: DUF935 family protein [Oleiagrimonas sp.]|nr:DUF935 family protein [Oleiagrimonas sp.]